MREVSCRALDIFFRELKKKRLVADVLAEGTGYSLAHLRNNKERIEWSAYIRFMRNARKFWNDADFIHLGGAVARSPVLKPFTLVIRLLFTAADTYRWMMSDSGAGKQMFNCMHAVVAEDAPDHLHLDLRLDDGYAPCREFYLITQGALTELPRLVGLGSATIEMTVHASRAVYEVRIPKRKSLWTRIVRFFLWPLTVRSVALELKEANELILQRYEELEKNKAVIDAQARRLDTAYSIGLHARRASGISEMVATIAKALVDQGGFLGAAVSMERDAENNTLDVQSTLGNLGEVVLSRPLVSRGVTVGQLTVGVSDDSATAERSSLLDFVMPTVLMAIDDALAYTALIDYRDNLEKKVTDRTEELKTARDALEQSYNALQVASETRERFFANINHELRTPLSMVRMVVETLPSREKLSERSLLDLQSVETSVQRLLRMVDEMLFIAANRENKLTLHHQKVNLSELVQRLVQSWLSAAENRRVTVVFSGPPSLLADVDTGAVERILMNLVSNAVKFTPSGGSIEVRLVDHEEEVQLEVVDTGPGFDKEFLSRVFGRFEQGQAPPPGVARGSGIGLSLVKELSEAHGGRVHAENNRRGGAVVRVNLPKHATGLDAEDALPAPRLRPTDYGVDFFSGAGRQVIEPEGTVEATVLVAEDDISLREKLGDVLSRCFRVILAPDGIGAVELARRHLPDILVTDLGMPGMDGSELTRRFRELPGNRLAPVIMLTAFGTLGDRLSGFDAGVIDYVTKPFSPDELIARIRSQLRMRSFALRLAENEKSAALSVISAGLAHEIRNPANGLLNALEPLKTLLPKALVDRESPSGALLEVISVCSKQIADLSRELLGLRGSTAEVFARERFSLILSRALLLAAPALKNVTVVNESANDPLLSCAPVLLVQALVNLLENAAHAAGVQGTVRVHTQETERTLTINVTDSGPGVPRSLRSRIFEPFFTTKSPNGGSGLGLSLAAEIVRRHNGALRLLDTPENAGAVFEIVLPLRGDAAAHKALS